MPTTLDYESPASSSSSPLRVVIGWVFAVVCLLISVHVAITTVHEAWILRHHPDYPKWQLDRNLAYIVPPIMLAVAAGCWCICRGLRVGWRIAGMSILLAAATWGIAVATFP
jgi:hypothetical protein